MKAFYIIILLVCLTSVNGCIEPLDIQTNTAVEVLVVEGTINTSNQRHRITLEQSAKYGDVFEGFSERVPGATVWVRDQDGIQFFFEEVAEGSYTSGDNFQAKAGNTYTLNITLENGERYVSLPEKIPTSPEIQSLQAINKAQPSSDDILFDSGFEIYATFQDQEDTQDFYQWNSTGEYRIESRPDLFVAGGEVPTPAPKDCCSICYVDEDVVDEEIRIAKDNLTNGSLTTQLVAYIPDNGRRFDKEYMVVVEQKSLTREAYQFFNLLKNQLSIDGDIFDPPPATIGGNIINLDNPDQPVIGYFAASDVKRDTIFIFNDQVTSPQPFNLLKDDCRVLRSSTTNMPPYWQF